MNSQISPTFNRSTVWLLLISALVGGLSASAQNDATDPEIQAYLDRVAELNRDGRALVQENGKGFLIGEYQALIDAHPDYVKNIQLETRIGEIYEWDYSGRGEPPDINSAYGVYLGIVESYSSEYEYTKLVYRRAADRAENIDPAAARELYAGMMQTYPDDPVIQLESLYRLGALAEREGNVTEARELFDMVLNYDANSGALNPDEAERIETLQAQAASLLMALATDPSATPEDRLAALDAFLNDNPNLLDEHGDVAENVRSALNRLQGDTPRDEVREALAELQAMLAERQEIRRNVDAPTGGESSQATSPRAHKGDGMEAHDLAQSQDSASTSSIPQASVGYPAARSNAFAGIDSGATSVDKNEDFSAADNRAAAVAAATVCALLAAAGLFALRKRFGN